MPTHIIRAIALLQLWPILYFATLPSVTVGECILAAHDYDVGPDCRPYTNEAPRAIQLPLPILPVASFGVRKVETPPDVDDPAVPPTNNTVIMAAGVKTNRAGQKSQQMRTTMEPSAPSTSTTAAIASNEVPSSGEKREAASSSRHRLYQPSSPGEGCGDDDGQSKEGPEARKVARSRKSGRAKATDEVASRPSPNAPAESDNNGENNEAPSATHGATRAKKRPKSTTVKSPEPAEEPPTEPTPQPSSSAEKRELPSAADNVYDRTPKGSAHKTHHSRSKCDEAASAETPKTESTHPSSAEMSRTTLASSADKTSTTPANEGRKKKRGRSRPTTTEEPTSEPRRTASAERTIEPSGSGEKRELPATTSHERPTVIRTSQRIAKELIVGTPSGAVKTPRSGEKKVGYASGEGVAISSTEPTTEPPLRKVKLAKLGRRTAGTSAENSAAPEPANSDGGVNAYGNAEMTPSPAAVKKPKLRKLARKKEIATHSSEEKGGATPTSTTEAAPKMDKTEPESSPGALTNESPASHQSTQKRGKKSRCKCCRHRSRDEEVTTTEASVSHSAHTEVTPKRHSAPASGEHSADKAETTPRTAEVIDAPPVQESPKKEERKGSTQQGSTTPKPSRREKCHDHSGDVPSHEASDAAGAQQPKRRRSKCGRMLRKNNASLNRSAGSSTELEPSEPATTTPEPVEPLSSSYDAPPPTNLERPIENGCKVVAHAHDVVSTIAVVTDALYDATTAVTPTTAGVVDTGYGYAATKLAAAANTRSEGLTPTTGTPATDVGYEGSSTAVVKAGYGHSTTSTVAALANADNEGSTATQVPTAVDVGHGAAIVATGTAATAPDSAAAVDAVNHQSTAVTKAAVTNARYEGPTATISAAIDTGYEGSTAPAVAGVAGSEGSTTADPRGSNAEVKISLRSSAEIADMQAVSEIVADLPEVTASVPAIEEVISTTPGVETTKALSRLHPENTTNSVSTEVKTTSTTTTKAPTSLEVTTTKPTSAAREPSAKTHGKAPSSARPVAHLPAGAIGRPQQIIHIYNVAPNKPLLFLHELLPQSTRVKGHPASPALTDGGGEGEDGKTRNTLSRLRRIIGLTHGEMLEAPPSTGDGESEGGEEAVLARH